MSKCIVGSLLISILFCQSTNGSIFLIGGNEGLASMDQIRVDGEPELSDVVPDYPLSISEAVGGVLNDQILVCGGITSPFTYHDDCYSLDSTRKEWVTRPSMKHVRIKAASVVINGTLWVTGGQTDREWTATTEYLQDNEWIAGPPLPTPLLNHCMALLDNETVLISGGLQRDFHPNKSRRSWLFHWSNKTFEETALLVNQRFAHACASLELANGTRAVAVVAGQSDQNYVEFSKPDLRCMELYFDGHWHLLNQPLPALADKVMWGASMVSLHDRLLLLGGITPRLGQLDTIYEYHESYGFRLLKQRLEQGRMFHVAASVDDGGQGPQYDYQNEANYTDLLIVGGYQSSGQGEVSVITFNSSNSNQEAIPDYPLDVIRATGQLIKGQPTICGGMLSSGQVTNKCHFYDREINSWNGTFAMKSPRSGSGSVLNSFGDFWVLGGLGSSKIVDTTEHLEVNATNWKLAGEMKRSIAQHCVVTLNDTNVMVIGGTQLEHDVQDDLKFKHVYLSDWLGHSWQELEPLSVPRFGHSCGLFTLANGTQVVVVAGGQTGNHMSSQIRHVEIFNTETGHWTVTDQTVGGNYDSGFYGASMVQTEDGLLLMGGTDGTTTFSAIYAYHEIFGFYALEKTLPQGRFDMTVIPLL